MAQDKAQHQTGLRPAGDDDAAASAGQAQARPASQDAGLDSLLDEIDAVLESNAEEFVKGFVQKGGQ